MLDCHCEVADLELTQELRTLTRSVRLNFNLTSGNENAPGRGFAPILSSEACAVSRLRTATSGTSRHIVTQTV